MEALIKNLEQLYNSGNTWAQALALVGTFVTLYLLKKLRDMKKEQNAVDTQKQKATDQATNRTENQKLEDQMKSGTDEVEKALEEIEAEVKTKDPKENQ